MKYHLTTSGGRAAVALQGDLTLSDRGAFDSLIPQIVKGGGDAIVVDLGGLTYMDSAGLGMLLTLREKAGAAGAAVVLAKQQGDVKDLLELACFNTLFTFE
ncbi:MAG: STAS domain-containing protein [Alphaproteobacteria bacterium]